MNTRTAGRSRAGFTLVEILVAVAILVVLFGLVSFLYAKASSVKRIIVAQNDVQQVLSAMISTLRNGADRQHLTGLLLATMMYENPPPYADLPQIGDPAYCVRFSNSSRTDISYLLIAPGANAGSPQGTGTDTTLWHAEKDALSLPGDGDWENLDLNRRVFLDAGSRFEPFTAWLVPITSGSDADEAVGVRVTLRAKSRERVLRQRNPVTVSTAVRLRNKASF